MPKTILVIRHAEKPEDPTDPDLTPEGQARSTRLVGIIPRLLDGPPDFIFASAISRHSARPYETMEPLARAVGKPIDATFADNDYGALAQDLRDDPRFSAARVVVCWHHGNIPGLMRVLGCPEGSFRDPWPHADFDLALKVTFDAAGPPAVASLSEDGDLGTATARGK